MNSNKIFLWPVIISIIGHGALISVSSMIDLRDNVKTAEIITVDIKYPEPAEQPPKKKEEKREIKKPVEAKSSKTIKADSLREDTVNLDSSDIKYAVYLVKIKKSLLQTWEYPQKAYEKNEEGVVVVKMSINADGTVDKTNLMSSSGSIFLDEATLGIVKAAAPFDPLPLSYSLSRLHIIASFSYKLVE